MAYINDDLETKIMISASINIKQTSYILEKKIHLSTHLLLSWLTGRKKLSELPLMCS